MAKQKCFARLILGCQMDRGRNKAFAEKIQFVGSWGGDKKHPLPLPVRK